MENLPVDFNLVAFVVGIAADGSVLEVSVMSVKKDERHEEAWELSSLPPLSFVDLPEAAREPAVPFRGAPLPVGAPELSQTDRSVRASSVFQRQATH